MKPEFAIKRLMIFVLLCIGCCSVSADDIFNLQEDLPNQSPINRQMLIVCGLPGDDLHREQMTQACLKIIRASQPVLGVTAENLAVLAGDEEMQAAINVEHPGTEIATRETILESLGKAGQDLGPNDGFWCLLIGHSHPYGAESQFNISGKDINQSEFAQAASSIHCREQVFWLTQPISGFWIKPLARPERIIITATEADLEFTGTEMPYALAAVLAGDAENQDLDDIDGDGTLSLLDLYLATNLEITARFRAIDRLQTEHAQLDDNGDGRGSELQQPYLPVEPEEDEEDEQSDEENEQEEEGDEAEAASEIAVMPKPQLIQSHNLDGFRSRYVLLQKPIKQSATVEEPAEADTDEAKPAN